MKYEVQISAQLDDQAWDAFLAATPGGHHVQTSLWAQVKAVLGWQAVRLIVVDSKKIVAGAQILIRSWPVLGAIGYLPKGPVFAHNDRVIIELVMNGLHQLAHKYRIHFLAIQPPNNGEIFTLQLSNWQFQPATIGMLPTATTWIDLTDEIDVILKRMKQKTRYNIRQSQRYGITVREGTEADLHEYYRLVKATSERQGFAAFTEEYFLKMWRAFSPHGYIKLFLVEMDNVVVSAQVAIAFGDTVLNKLGAWSGDHSAAHPNEALHWGTIMWAKEHGYRYYDFEGIEPEVAHAILENRDMSYFTKQTVGSFKLGFGGDVKLLPKVYGYIQNPVMRWAYNTIVPRIKDLSFVNTMLHRLRTS